MFINAGLTATTGQLGMQRMTAPHNIDTKPTAIEMPHSRPPMRTT